MNEISKLLLAFFVGLVVIWCLNKFQDYTYKRLADRWNEQRRINKINKSIAKSNRK